MTFAAPLLELVGVAGAGKTTLLETLKRRDPSLQTEVRLGRVRRLELLVRHTVLFFTPFLRHAPRGRWLRWHELRLMAYLEGWQTIALGDRTSPMVLDHGPIYQLVQLREFGPPLVASPAFGSWWSAARRAWTRALDLVVWLDAPDAVLLARINTRDQRHVVKHKPVAAAIEVLTTYRRGYERLLAEMADEAGFRLMRFDTSRVPLETIAEEVLGAVRAAPIVRAPAGRAGEGSLS